MILLGIFIAVWISVMLFTILLVSYPPIVRITRPFICKPGEVLTVETWQVSPHHYGRRGIEVYADSMEGRQSVKGKALFVLWLMCLVVSTPIGLIAAWLFTHWMPK